MSSRLLFLGGLALQELRQYGSVPSRRNLGYDLSHITDDVQKLLDVVVNLVNEGGMTEVLVTMQLPTVDVRFNERLEGMS